MGSIVKIFALTVAFICLVIVACLGSLAIFYSNLPSALRPIAGGGICAGGHDLHRLRPKEGQKRGMGRFPGLVRDGNRSLVAADSAVQQPKLAARCGGTPLGRGQR